MTRTSCCWEGFVIENLIAAAPERTLASFYRTTAGADAFPVAAGLEAVGVRELTEELVRTTS